MHRLLKPLWVLIALVFLVEAWLWDRLRPPVAWIVGLVPWAWLKARIAAFVERLPPAAALIVFVVPAALILPFKIVGLWLIAREHVILGAATFLMAKFVGLGVTAFLFDLTRDKLLTMGWFARLYGAVLVARDWAHRQVAPARQRIGAFVRSLRAGAAGHWRRRLTLLRRRARKAAAAP